MNIEKINKKHQFEVDMYTRAEYGLSSKLIGFNNQVISLQVTLTKRRKQSYANLALDLANFWKTNHKELTTALACRVYFVDLYSFPFKRKEQYNFEDYDARKGIIFYKSYLN